MKIEGLGINPNYTESIFFADLYEVGRDKDGNLALIQNKDALPDRWYCMYYSYKSCYRYIQSTGLPYFGCSLGAEFVVSSKTLERILKGKFTFRERFCHFLWMAGL